ncbi:uncharacterized protein LOC107042167 [Diachasma alloeum]|uniref:uncharacterized protein LOC107042167 n=1 Tax=Diachasma alloeum TaxID=454923 RepID=UPI00073829A5|nr:uncharacterized protein LOC107042167 [Diachasma alloeum]
MEALSNLNVPGYLQRMVRSYFTDRVLKYDADIGPKEYRVTGGVPQGSVPGSLVARYVRRIRQWMDSVRLTLAENKAEAVLITSRQKFETITLYVGNHEIMSQPSLQYLGVMIDNRLSFKQQVECVSAKASGVRTVLSRLMPNIEGPKQKRRALLSSVVTSVLTYGIPIWADVLLIQHARRKVASVYRLSAFRVASAFRTVSEDAGFKYEESPECPACTGVSEDAKHVFFVCQRFNVPRSTLETALGVRIQPENLVEVMLSSEAAWEATSTFVAEVLKDLRKAERERNRDTRKKKSN